MTFAAFQKVLLSGIDYIFALFYNYISTYFVDDGLN